MQKWKINNKPVVILKPIKAGEQKISLEMIATLFYDHLCRYVPTYKNADLPKLKRGSK